MGDITMARVEQIVRELDPNITPEDNAYKTAVLLIAALSIGPSVPKLVKFTGYSYAFVMERNRRFRSAGVWRHGKTYAEWFDEDTGGMAFWLDVSVGEGLVKRA